MVELRSHLIIILCYNDSLWILVAHVYYRDIPPTVVHWVRWQPSRQGFVTLNTDGSSVGILGPAGLGGVVWCDDGNRIFGFNGHIEISDSIYAELFAVRSGLSLYWDRGFRQIELFTNSMLALGLLLQDHPPYYQDACILLAR